MEKKIYFILVVILLIVFVMAADFTPQGNINLRGVLNITNVLYYNGTDMNITGTLYGGAFSGPINWTFSQNYPSACPSGTFLTQLDDSVTCTAPVADDVDPGSFPAGNYTFNGNVTASNVFLPAFIFAHTNETILVASAGVWYNVTFSEEVSYPKFRITHTYDDSTNDTFTIVDDGYYIIHYTMSFQDATASPSAHVMMRVVKNGVEIPGSLLEEDSSKQYSDFTISNGPIVYLVTGDEIKFQFAADDTDVSLTSHATYGGHRDTAIVKITKISN